MNVFNKVTLQSLRKNKTRTVVTIIGIMLSAALICAVTTFISSLQNYGLQFVIYNDGDWHGCAKNTDLNVYEEISKSEEVSNAVYGQLLGYAEIGSKSEYKPYLYVIGGEEGSFVEIMPIHLTSGEYPQNSREIILPDHLANSVEVYYKIGDKLTLALGERMLDGYALGQKNPCYKYDDDENREIFNDETLVVRENRTYTVVGFYERPGFEEFNAPGYTAITVADKNASASYKYDVYFKMENPQEVYDFMSEHGIEGETNTSVLMLSGVSRYSSFDAVLYSLAAIVIGLIMFGSISLIYNAFSISVSERTKQFGLLSSIGATKKQLRNMVIFEAFAVSAVGIPLGILLGIGGITITLLLIGDKFAVLAAGTNMDTPMRICVSPMSIVIACVLALITVLISAWIPSKRATKISAVEAIRQTSDIKAKNKPVKTSKLTYKLFGLPGVLANKHYKRNRKKYRTTIVSLFMSIVLFVSASAFTDYLMESVDGTLVKEKYDLAFNSYEDDFSNISQDELLKQLKEDEGVTDAAYIQKESVFCQVPVKYLNEDIIDDISSYEDIFQETDPSYKYINATLCFVDDTNFKKLLKEYNLDEKTYMDPDAPLAVAVNGSTIFDVEKEKYVTINILNSDNCELKTHIIKDIEGYYFFDEHKDSDGNMICKYVSYDDSDTSQEVLEFPLEEVCTEYNLKSGKTIYDHPFYINVEANIIFIYPYSLKSEVVSENQGNCIFFFTSNNHKTSYNAIKETLKENGFNNSNLYDYAKSVESNRNIVLIIKVFAYGFIVLISLIAAANVFNTISTNISLRRREFAMLKSVGMTDKGFNKMMNFECLLYGSKALLYGLPVSVLITYFIYRAICNGYTIQFYLPWSAIGIAVLSVFAVVFVTMMYSMSKIREALNK